MYNQRRCGNESIFLVMFLSLIRAFGRDHSVYFQEKPVLFTLFEVSDSMSLIKISLLTKQSTIYCNLESCYTMDMIMFVCSEIYYLKVESV